MKADRLREALQNGRFATGHEARERAVESARAEVAVRRSPKPRRRQLALATVALLACLALAAVTPPGQAATGWVSDLISGPNEFQPGQYGYQLQTSTLIGSGELPNGDRYQVRGYVGNGDDGGCAAVIWENSDWSIARCANVSPPWKEGEVSAPDIGRLPEDVEAPGASGTVVIGVAPKETTVVEIRVPASDGVRASEEQAQLFPIDGSISDTTGATADVPRVQFYVGYLPPGAGDLRSAPAAKAVAFSGDKELGSSNASWIRFSPEGDDPLIISCVAGAEVCQTVLSRAEAKRQADR
jgi:hypothetical protein